MVRKQVYISDSLDRALNRVSAQEAISESEVMRRALEVYLSKTGLDLVSDPLRRTIGLAGNDGPGTGSLHHDDIYDYVWRGHQNIEAVIPGAPESVAISNGIVDEKKTLAAKPKAAKTATAAKVPGRDQEGHCRVCGKTLKQEKDVVRGIGPVCFAAMKRTFKWTDADAKDHVDHESDEEWKALIEQIHELLYKSDVPLTVVPEGYVEMSKWWREAERHNLSGSAIKRAVGGDRAVGETLDEEFQCVYVQVGKRPRKFLPPEAMAEEAFAKIAASQKPRILTGAAKAAKEKAEAKPPAGIAPSRRL